MRAYLYARYSSDRQRETSIDDQIRVCRARADAEGWELLGMHRDEEVSGSTPVGARTGGAALLVDAMAGRLDVLVLEGLDRLSRDLVEQETIVRRLEHRGIRIVGVADGYDSESAGRKLHRGMRGLINEIYLDDLRHKTHRGQAGQVARGYSAGGGGYGYRSVHDGKGYLIEVVPEQAQWVVWVYERFALDGWGVRRIAAELNCRKVPSPRGGTWSVSAVYGNKAKGCGLLANPLYRGEYIWNRSQWVKNPDTGQRQRLERPEHEWMREDRPELRIVPEELWQAAQKRREEPKGRGGTKGSGAAPRTLLGGLMVCGYCGAPVRAVSNRSYGCSARYDRGRAVCRGVLIRRDHAERRLLAHLRDDLLAPGSIRELEKHIAALLAAHTSEAGQAAKAARARLVELDGEIGRLVDAIAAIGISASLKDRLREAEAERIRLRQAIASPVSAPKVAPAAADIIRRYRELVLNLQNALGADVDKARGILRTVLGEVVLVEEGENLWAQIEQSPRQLLAAGGLSLEMVAGACFINKSRILLR